MLILTGKSKDNIMIYDKKSRKLITTIQILAVTGGQIRMGFSADDSIGIDREVIYKKKMRGEH